MLTTIKTKIKLRLYLKKNIIPLLPPLFSILLQWIKRINPENNIKNYFLKKMYNKITTFTSWVQFSPSMFSASILLDPERASEVKLWNILYTLFTFTWPFLKKNSFKWLDLKGLRRIPNRISFTINKIL